MLEIVLGYLALGVCVFVLLVIISLLFGPIELTMQANNFLSSFLITVLSWPGALFVLTSKLFK